VKDRVPELTLNHPTWRASGDAVSAKRMSITMRGETRVPGATTPDANIAYGFS